LPASGSSRLYLLDHDDLAPEASEGLRELERRRTAPEADEPPRQPLELEDGLVRQVENVLEAEPGRDERPRSRGYDGALEAQAPLIHGELVLAGEACLAVDDDDAAAGAALVALVAGDLGDDAGTPGRHAREVELRRLIDDALGGRAPEVVGELRRLDEGFRRDAAGERAVAAQAGIALHERDAGALVAGGQRGGHSRRSPADHDDLVVLLRHLSFRCSDSAG
jgi:hypothetical protein